MRTIFIKAVFCALFLLLSVVIASYKWGGSVQDGARFSMLPALFICVGLVVLERFRTKRLLWGLLGFIAGALTSRLVNGLIEPFLPLLEPIFIPPIPLSLIWQGISLFFFATAGVAFALQVEKEPYLLQRRGSAFISNSKILDTSVIIDGRIADLCETGFLEGTLVVPQFVLQELQAIADSSDAIRRGRGRRGLDVLHRLQKMDRCYLRIVDDDFPAIREVDAKIVALARHLSAKVVTNDVNLNRVAELQGVSVLNIHQLSHALRPVVLPGETLRVLVSKEGKEALQGVGYLNDGTMIVIDEAKKWIGKNVDVVVTSILQTSVGRMIFARAREEIEHEAVVAPAAKG